MSTFPPGELQAGSLQKLVKKWWLPKPINYETFLDLILQSTNANYEKEWQHNLFRTIPKHMIFIG